MLSDIYIDFNEIFAIVFASCSLAFALNEAITILIILLLFRIEFTVICYILATTSKFKLLGSIKYFFLTGYEVFYSVFSTASFNRKPSL